jgi:penicillin amidase/acyl-homoserine-lactone acylase
VSPRKTLIVRSLLVILIVLGLAASWIFWPRSVDLSAFQDLGSQYDVRILRDTYGVPHIFGKTDVDAAFGLAYAHAEDDFLTIQQTLVAARGELARVYGANGGGNDFMVGLLRIEDVVEKEYPNLSAEGRAIMEAYAAGLNYYAARHPQEILLPSLYPLDGQDIVTGSVHKEPLFFDFDDVLAELFEDTRQHPLTTRTTSVIEPHSNAMAVSPLRSADGGTYLAVNSHQDWEGPTTWYEVHIHSEQGWNITGATFPGVPAVIHGHNPHLGWAFTVNKPDLADVFVLEVNPDNPNQYRFDGQWLDFEVRQVPIEARIIGNLTWTVKQEALWTVYGPAVRRPHGVYAVRYAGYGKVNIFEQLYRMNKAVAYSEWRDAVAEGGLPNFNIVYADAQGNIFYLYNALLPVRTEGYDWTQYLPGDTSETLWTETITIDQMPQVFNPASGYVVNANHTPFQTTAGSENPLAESFSPTWNIELSMTNRGLRLHELFGADPQITWEDFIAYKFDRFYSQDSDMAGIQAVIADAQFADPDLQAAQALVADWNLEATQNSPAMTIMVYTANVLREQGLIRGSRMTGMTASAEHILPAFEQAVASLKEKFRRISVAWGDVNRLVRGSVDLPLGGGPDLLRAVYGHLQEDGRLIGYVGDSYIQLVRWHPDGSVQSWSIHQFGSATLDVTSPHYADQSPLFAREEMKPAWFTEAEIRAHLEREYRP